MPKLSNKKMIEIITAAVDDFEGQSQELETAIGALAFGREIGWAPLFLMHSPRTIKNYERILGISFKEVLDEEGVKVGKARAYNELKRLKLSYYKAVNGLLPKVKSSIVDLITG